jgi:hypothetical protein
MTRRRRVGAGFQGATTPAPLLDPGGPSHRLARAGDRRHQAATALAVAVTFVISLVTILLLTDWPADALPAVPLVTGAVVVVCGLTLAARHRLRRLRSRRLRAGNPPGTPSARPRGRSPSSGTPVIVVGPTLLARARWSERLRQRSGQHRCKGCRQLYRRRGQPYCPRCRTPKGYFWDDSTPN